MENSGCSHGSSKYIFENGSLGELQREMTGVGENTFCIKSECYLLGLLQKFLHHIWGASRDVGCLGYDEPYVGP